MATQQLLQELIPGLPKIDTALVWFRRDLRVYDNPALIAALHAAKTVVPVFIWSPEEEGQFQPGRHTRWWTKHSVRKFGEQLTQIGSRLIIKRSEEAVHALLEVIRDAKAQAVFFNHLYDSISMVRDRDLKQALESMGVICRTYNSELLYEPWEVTDNDGQPFTTYKGFWDKCISMPYPPSQPLSAPPWLPPVHSNVGGLAIEDVDWFFTAEQELSTEQLKYKWKVGMEGAHELLEQFIEETGGLADFEMSRAKTDRDSTSMLSPWLHFGSISIRYVYYRVAQKHAEWLSKGQDRTRGCLDFLQQVGYREYSRYLSFHFPFITERSMLAHLRAVPWKLDQARFKAWRQGLTGYPLIDAGMKQLWAMGWAHNRVRVVASSFMVKNLLLPWQWGLKHLWDCQVDADLECDALGWQYVSGCLADAHPFSYMIDFEKECQRFDPDGEYVRRWLPVLAHLPREYVHTPWKAPDHILLDAGVELGYNYPLPVVSMDQSKQDVQMASSVVERCCSGSQLARKEPYRPPSDPAVLHVFLAHGEDFNWVFQYPEGLYNRTVSGTRGLLEGGESSDEVSFDGRQDMDAEDEEEDSLMTGDTGLETTEMFETEGHSYEEEGESAYSHDDSMKLQQHEMRTNGVRNGVRRLGLVPEGYETTSSVSGVGSGPRETSSWDESSLGVVVPDDDISSSRRHGSGRVSSSKNVSSSKTRG